MSTALLSSKIVIQEEEPQIRQIAGVLTNKLGLVGVTEKGPFGPTSVSSPAEYRGLFGGYVGAGDVLQAIDGFFSNGGNEAVISRVVHYTDPSDPATATSAAATFSFPDATPDPALQVDGKYDGAYGNALIVKVQTATDGITAHFNLLVTKSGVTLESFPNLSMVSTDARFVETIVNDPEGGSRYISVDALTALRPVSATGTLVGGSDGLVGLVDNDFIGSVGVNGRTGMRSFDVIDDMALLAIPNRATAAVHNAMIAYCEVTRDKRVFAILDPPANASAAAIVTYVVSTAALEGLSEFGAIYWPRIEVLNPSKAVFGNTARLGVAPSGYIAGVMARIDGKREGGVYDNPAGVENGILLGVLGFETDETLDEGKRDIVAPHRINPLTTMTGQPRFIDGTSTLKANGNFPNVAERRGAIYIEQSIKAGLQFARHKNNDESLRAEVSRTCESFLTIQMKNRAFRSKDPKTAFFVDFGEGLNSVATQFAQKLIGRIGIATQKPATFIIVSFSQDTRAFDNQAAA